MRGMASCCSRKELIKNEIYKHRGIRTRRHTRTAAALRLFSASSWMAGGPGVQTRVAAGLPNWTEHPEATPSLYDPAQRQAVLKAVLCAPDRSSAGAAQHDDRDYPQCAGPLRSPPGKWPAPPPAVSEPNCGSESRVLRFRAWLHTGRRQLFHREK